jgi:biotin carboxylase
VQRPTVVLVDAGGVGSRFAHIFREHGWGTIAVSSSSTVPDFVVRFFRKRDYDEVLDFEAHRETLVDRLSASNVRAVVPVFETGVELADWLAERLGVAGNGTALSTCRRHKGAMGDRLRACGVPCAEHIVTADQSTLDAWARARDRWPVVVKPVASAGSDHINICHSPADIPGAFRSIVGTRDALGNENRELIAQEFLTGQQYLINSVSRDGELRIGAIWRFDSSYEEGIHIYDKQELLEPDGDLQDSLVEYATRVLEALGIRYGAAHTEIMLTGRGPILLECAARITGGINPYAEDAAVGHDHLTLNAEAYTEPDRFLSRPQRYTLRQRLGIVALRSPVDGQVAAGDALEELLSLPTFAGCIPTVYAGARVERTRSFMTSPALVYLLGDTMEGVRRDMAAIRRIEASGRLYVADANGSSAGG